jgi:hypothetical protein
VVRLSPVPPHVAHAAVLPVRVFFDPVPLQYLQDLFFTVSRAIETP